MKEETLKSLHIDVENGIYEVNGRDISKSGKYLNLVFENGAWSLMISEDTIYTTSNQNIKELVLIRKELQAIRSSLEFNPDSLSEAIEKSFSHLRVQVDQRSLGRRLPPEQNA